mmetsp:Transcript_68042/g.183163  ORF Transcript_68042/g.183163 Transcript_68042/m.183163 type:complete len:235 (-) Transcript_68042:132-836(-)
MRFSRKRSSWTTTRCRSSCRTPLQSSSLESVAFGNACARARCLSCLGTTGGWLPSARLTIRMPRRTAGASTSRGVTSPVACNSCRVMAWSFSSTRTRAGWVPRTSASAACPSDRRTRRKRRCGGRRRSSAPALRSSVPLAVPPVARRPMPPLRHRASMSLPSTMRTSRTATTKTAPLQAAAAAPVTALPAIPSRRRPRHRKSAWVHFLLLHLPLLRACPFLMGWSCQASGPPPG